MRSCVLIACLIFVMTAGRGQECPALINPVPGSINVPVNTSISWQEVVGVTGYIISLGTTPEGTDIVNEQPVGSETTFTPPMGLPESTEIFVTITLFFINQNSIVCSSVSFTTEDVTDVPGCTMIIQPVNGETNVNITSNISWTYATFAIGYRISLGTAPGSGDILTEQDVGNELSFDPPSNLPPLTQIFVTLTPYNENGDASGCPSESFTTGDLGEPPACTVLIRPADGSTNVPLDTTLEWIPVPEATGYIVSVGSSPFVNDVLDMAIFTNPMINVINFEPNKTYFVKIIPFNEAGQAQGCGQQSFSTILGCGPFYDPLTGNLIVINPEITFPDEIAYCQDAIVTRIEATDPADGYRWYRIVPGGTEILLSEENYLELSEPGQYRYEAYIELTQDGFVVECSSDKEFTTVLSSRPTIEMIRKEIDGDFFNLRIITSGLGDYEYSLNSTTDWQMSSRYRGLSEGNYTVYVRDTTGCGIVEQSFRLALPAPGFPPYFSPNGDGINDTWNYIPPKSNPIPLTYIYIYDRYGKILATINANANGWDGLYEGTPMPLGGYWYRAVDVNGLEYNGHFSLIR